MKTYLKFMSAAAVGLALSYSVSSKDKDPVQKSPAQIPYFVDDEPEVNPEDILGNFYESQDRKRAKVKYEKLHRSTLSEFEPVVAQARQSTVRIHKGELIVAFGTVVAPEGLIVTKASEVGTNDLIVELPNKEKKPAELVRVDEENDLALLWVHEYDLQPVTWASGKDLPVGSLVSATGALSRPVSVGTISLGVRNLAENRKGFLGIRMEAVPKRKGLLVVEIIPGSGAEQAEIEQGDVILSIDGKPMNTQHDLINTISQGEPGDIVVVEFERRGDKQVVEVALGDRQTGIPFIPMHQMLDNTARMGGRVSKNRSGFPAAMQHDLMLKPNQCGGPLVDLDGNAVGINIARASRVKSYAIPSEVVQAWLGDPKLLAEEVLHDRIKNAEAARVAAEEALTEAQQAEDEVRDALDELKSRREARAAEEAAAAAAEEAAAAAAAAEEAAAEEAAKLEADAVAAKQAGGDQPAGEVIDPENR